MIISKLVDLFEKQNSTDDAFSDCALRLSKDLIPNYDENSAGFLAVTYLFDFCLEHKINSAEEARIFFEALEMLSSSSNLNGSAIISFVFGYFAEGGASNE